MRFKVKVNRGFLIVVVWGLAVIILGSYAYLKLYIFVKPNVILISIDTLRADRLSCYGYKYRTSPHIDVLADDGVLFEKVYTPSPWTLPSHMSILTSLYPEVHNVQTKDDRLSDGFITLSEILKDNGYYTAAYVDAGFLSAKFGYDQGFDIYVDHYAGVVGIDQRAIRFVEQFCNKDQSDKKYFFLFYHIFDVHGPYEPPQPYKGLFYEGKDPYDKQNHSMDLIKQMSYHSYLKFGEVTDINYVKSLYDSQIKYVDDQLEKLFQKLKELALLPKVYLISDR